jgi:type IV pilus assembly protein PilE
MKTKYGNGTRGFTIIELMIVLVIVAILVALAYPSYIDYVRKARRGEAQQLLMNWSINQEIFRSNNPGYATTGELPPPTNEHYIFDLPVRSATQFTLRATAQGDQVNDTAKGDCTVLTLASTGAKSLPICWGASSS